MTLLTIRELVNCDAAKYGGKNGKNRDEPARAEELQTLLQELILRAGVNKEDSIERILREVNGLLTEVIQSHEEELGALEADAAEEAEKITDLEEAIQEAYDYQTLNDLQEAAATKTDNRRRLAKKREAELRAAV